MKMNIAGAIRAIAAGGILVAFAASAEAAPVQVGYGGIPGGMSYSASGGPASASGGLTYEIFVTDSAYFAQSWLGLFDIASGMDGNTPGSAGSMTFAGGLGTNVAEWTGADFVTTSSGDTPILTKFTATLDGGTWIDPASEGIAGVPAVTSFSSGSVKIKLEFFASLDTDPGSATYLPFLTLFEANDCGYGCDGFAQTSLNFTYFYTPLSGDAAVPLPAALPLFVTALGGMGLVGWRKRKKAA